MTVLILACIVGSGLMAGLFYAFSAFIMRAFAAIGPDRGIAAMNSINVTILRSSFLAIFFGTVIAGLVALVLAFARGLPGLLLVAGAFVVYLVGTIAVTIAANVPLNNRLAAAVDDPDGGHAAWEHYLVAWVRWNHVRTIACIVACALYALALRA